VNPALAPGTTWEVRLRWGSRRLTAEVLGLARRELSLGDRRDDDFDTGAPARLEFALAEDGALRLAFSTGVAGTVSLAGDRPAPLGQLTQRGVAVELPREGPEPLWALTLRERDQAALKVGALTVEVRRARGRLRQLPFDARVLLGVALGLLAIGLIVASVLAPHRGANPKWLSGRFRAAAPPATSRPGPVDAGAASPAE
jgi:hypothetical protein